MLADADVELEKVTALALSMTHDMLLELQRRFAAPVTGRNGEVGREGLEHKTSAQFKALGTDLTKNVRALTGMLREARAQKKDAYALFKKMTLAERSEVVIAHLREHLTVEQKKDLIRLLLGQVNEERA